MSAVWAVLGAIIGAGFASGREIMQFFSQYGVWSWPLALLAAVGMGLLMAWVMTQTDTAHATPPAEAAVMIPLLATVGGGMTAAAGELAALTLPLRHARSLGALGTLAICAWLSNHSLRALIVLGRVLLPLTALAFLVCLPVAASQEMIPTPSAAVLPMAALRIVGYSSMNVQLAAEVLREAGKGKTAQEKRRLVLAASCLLLGLLFLGNAALAPRAGTLQNAALPTVMLLRRFGKAGYYGAAAVLYLAVATTLIAVLRGLRTWLPRRSGGVMSALLTAGASLCGFAELVATAYPVLGWCCLLLSILFRFLRTERRKQN